LNQTEFRHAVKDDSFIWARLIRKLNYKSEATICVLLCNFEITVLDVLGTACNIVQLRCLFGNRDNDRFRGRTMVVCHNLGWTFKFWKEEKGRPFLISFYLIIQTEILLSGIHFVALLNNYYSILFVPL